MMFLMIVGVVAIVTVAAVGRPLAEAYSEKQKAKYRELGSDAEDKLKQRVAFLESEIDELKRQLHQIQETNDFTIKMLEKEKSEGQ